MNPPDLAAWGRLWGLLALEGLVFGLVAWGLAARVPSASGRRRVWQVALMTLGLIAVMEWSGARTTRSSWRSTAPEVRNGSRVVRVTMDPLETAEAPGSFEPTVLPTGIPAAPTQGLAPVTWPGWLWLAGLNLSLGGILWRRMVLAWMARRAASADAATEASVEPIRRRLAMGRVRVVAWSGLRGPIAYGILRPTVAVPSDFAERFGAREREAMLAHELAHLAGHDPLWLLVSDLVCALWWWHPVAWWARGRLRAASEEVADAASSLVPTGSGALAECLVRLARDLAAPDSPRGLGVWGSGRPGELRRRVQALLDRPAAWRHPGRWDSARGGALVLGLTAAVIATPLPGSSEVPLITSLAAAPAAASRADSEILKDPPPAASRPGTVVEPSDAVPEVLAGPSPLAALAGLPFETPPSGQVPGRSLEGPIPPTHSVYVRLRDVTPEELAASARQKPSEQRPEGPRLHTRGFRVQTPRLLRSVRSLEGISGEAEMQAQVWEFFRQCGLSLAGQRPEGTPLPDQPAVFLDPDAGRLLVRTWAAELETVERVLALLEAGSGTPEPAAPAVTLSGFFAEVSVGGPEEIGLDWVFGQASTNNPAAESLPWPVTPGGSRFPSRGRVERLRNEGQFATLSAPQFQALLARLSHAAGVDLLTAPRVSTVSGRPAKVQVREVRTVVTGVGARVDAASQATGFDLVEPGTAAGAEVRYFTQEVPTGPELEIQPEAAGGVWRLTLTARLTEFLGYDDPGKFQAVLQTGKAKPLTAQLPLPRLRHREATGEARVESGGAVVLRGPMVEERLIEKGGFFRRGTTNVVQKRLYVLVQAETASNDAPGASAPEAPAVHPVVVRIPGGSDPYQVGGRVVQEFEISGVLRSLALSRPGLRLILCADWDAEWRRVVSIREVVQDAGVPSVEVQRAVAPGE